MKSWIRPLISVVIVLALGVVSHGNPDIPEVFVESVELPITNGVPQHYIAAADVEWPLGTKKPMKFQPPCDVTANRAVCLYSGRQVIVPDASPEGLVGAYTFNELLQGDVVDRSGNQNHGIIGPKSAKGVKSLRAAPDRNGGGSSAAFTAGTYVRIPPSPSIDTLTKDFTATFWVFLADPTIAATLGGCPLYGIGENVVYILPSRHLSVSIKGKPIVQSRVVLREGHWSHIAVSFDSTQRKFSLYVNGILDLDLTTSLEMPMSTSVYLGGYPKSQCTAVSFYLDDIRLSNKVLDAARIGAEAFPALGAVEPSFVQLGCSRTQPCNWEQARSVCNPGYHVCSERELRSGAYSVGRVQGWISWNDALWVNEDSATKQAPKSRKVALCCAY